LDFDEKCHFLFFFNNHDHWPWPPRELALASNSSGLGLGLEHAVLEPIPVISQPPPPAWV